MANTLLLLGSASAASAVVADFTGSPLSVTAPAAVTFTDASTGTVDSRLWDFGDGTTSTATSPVHTYSAPGTYTVTLTATGPLGSNTKTRTAYVSVGVLLDQFTTTAAAPLGTRTCEPGPGTLAFTDSANVMAISGARLVVLGSPAATDGFIISASVARVAGLACFLQAPAASDNVHVGGGNSRYGFVSTNSIAGTEAASISYSGSSSGDVVVQPINQSIKGAFTNNAFIGDVAVVLRGTGAFFLVRTAGDGVWKLAYLTNSGTASPVWLRYKLSANSYNLSLDNCSVVNLAAPWTTDTGIALSTASLNAGDTFACGGDCLLECSRAVVTNDVWDIQLRRAGDNDCWVVRLDQANSLVSLFEKVAGVETSRASAAQTLNNGTTYRAVITADTQQIAVYVNDVQKLYYTAAATQQTTQGGKTTLAATVNVYPRYFSGAAETAIDAAYPFGNPGFATIYADNSLAADTINYVPASRQGSGGVARAYKTLGSAITNIVAGGTVIVRGGTYAETNTAQFSYEPTVSCTITVAAGEAAVLTYDPNNVPFQDGTNVGQIVYAQPNVNVTLDGTPGTLEIRGTYALGPTVGARNNTGVCVMVVGGATVRGCLITQWGHAGLKTPTTLTGAVLVEKNKFYGPAGFTQLDHGMYLHAVPASGRVTARWNWVTAATGYGIHCYSTPTNHDVYGNVVWACGTYPVFAGGGGGGIYLGGSGNVLAQNTIYGNGGAGGSGSGGIVLGSLAGDGACTIANNIVRNNNYADLSTGAGPQAGANTFQKNDLHTQTGSGYDGSTAVDLDPLFVVASPNAAADFRLQSGSPVKGIGFAVGAPYNQLLDPASTAAPAAQAGTSTNLGAWA